MRISPFVAAMTLSMSTIAIADVPSQEFTDAMSQVAQWQEAGKLAEADQLVRQTLEKGPSAGQKRELEFELERSVRIRQDYTLTEEGLLKVLKERVKDLTDAEYQKWLADGRFDYKTIGGEKLFVGASAANLLFRHEDASARRMKPETFRWEDFLVRHIEQVEREVTTSAQSTGEPHQFRLTMTITVDAGAVPAGDLIRCWMPYPLQNEHQSGVELLVSNPPVKWINAPAYPVRSLYFEQPSNGEKETVFEATYTVTTYPRRNRIDAELVGATDQRAGAASFDYFTREQPPHVVFNDRIRDLASEIVGKETNPAIKARLIYDWIAKMNKYSYAREYSTLRNIPEYVLDNGYGDCGQMALLYISLCRASGIPARWQSGWVIYPQLQNLHDWTEIWLAPYGWVPVDPDYAMEIQQYFRNCSPEVKARLKDFYFGGLDAYRLAVNSEHGYPHHPAKEGFRSDTVDFQRGEVESKGKNVYFNLFSYKMKAEFLQESDFKAAKEAEKPANPGPLQPGLAR